MIAISKKYCSEVNKKLNEILKKYEITPKTFKWNKFNSKKKINALKEFLDYLFRLMSRDIVHINTTIWDIHDSRHEILGRDDKKLCISGLIILIISGSLCILGLHKGQSDKI